MKTKKFFCLSMLLLFAVSVWSQKPSNVPLRPMIGDSIVRPTSLILDDIPIVSLDGTELTFDFSPATVSQIVIMDEDNQNQVVYSGSFLSSTQVVVDLENEGVGKGIYLLWLYAFGEWWQGEFEIIEEDN